MNIKNLKLPPQAKEVEIAVIGAIMLESAAYDLVSTYLNPSSFYVESHQKIFRAIETLKKSHSPVDIITVVQELTSSGDLEGVGGAYEVVKFTNAVVSSANIEAHAKIVCEKAIMRNLIKSSSDIINAAYEEGTDVFDLLQFAESSIKSIGDSTVQGGMVGIQSVVLDSLKKIEEWRLNDSTLTGIPTGFPELDRATRGWQNGDLIVIAARPGGGKTAMALNLIRNAALNTKKPTVVAAWSLEMKATFLVLRMLAAESEIILHKIQTGRLTDREMDQLMVKGAEVLSKASIYFDENSHVTLKSLKAKARRLKKQNNLGMIVIDYLQLMSGDTSKGNREQEISSISRELKNLAQELDVPVIALSQLSREGAKTVSWEVSPPASALRESGAIEQDADLIIMLWGANESEIAHDGSLEGKRKIRIVKQRNGVLLTMELDFRSEIQLFESIKNNF